MISVTNLTTYMFCPRKLYLLNVLEFEEPPKEAVLLGSVKHNVFDKINKADELIVTSILKSTQQQEIEIIYRKKYSEILRNEIKQNKKIIDRLKLSSKELFEEIWPLFLDEAQARSYNISEFIEEHNLFGEELWNALTPKILTEIKLVSKELELMGVIDRIEIRDQKYIPIELKTGVTPKSNVWPEHKIQIGAYGMLIESQLNKSVSHGFIDYTSDKEKRLVYINPFLKVEINKLIREVKKLLESNKLPPIIENKNKCKSCSLKEECYKMA